MQGTGNLGGIAKIKDPKSGEQIPVFFRRDRYTHELEYMRADKWKCPDTICNVKVSLEQKAAFEAGQAVKMENLQFRDGMKRLSLIHISYRFSLPSLMGGFRFAAGLRCIIRLVLPLGRHALRDKFFPEIIVYLRHTAALLCHITVI